MSAPRGPPGKFPPLSAPPGTVPPPAVPIDLMSDFSITSEQISGNDACIKRMRELNLRPGEKVYPSPKPPGTGGVEIDIQTNLFGIEVHRQHDIFQYTVNIKADLAPTKEVVFTKKGKEDYIVMDRHEKCCAIFYHALKKHEDFFRTASSTYVYDAQSMLFSTTDLFAGEGTAKTQCFEINGSEIDNEDLKNLTCIKVEVYATKNPSIKFTQEDIGRRTSDSRIDSVNRGYHQIIELALNQNCIKESSRCAVFENGKVFFFNPLEEGYWQEDCVEVGDGKQMLPGIKKTVHFVEGPFGRGQNNPSVVIDGMKVAFHKEQLIIDKLREISSNDIDNGINDIERERCMAVIKGLDCYSNYLGRVVHLKIEGIHHEGATTSRFQLKDGKAITVFNYFREKYNIVLQYPNANLIICKVRGQQNVYPMELLTITPNQRVKITQQTSNQSQRTTKESAVLPDVRQRLIMTGKRAAGITPENPILNGLGIMVMEEPLVVKGRQLPPVKLATHPTGAPIFPKDSKWRINQYTRPATPPDVWALYCVGTRNTPFTDLMLKQFCEEYVTMFKSKGVKMPPAAEIDLIVMSDIEQKLEQAAKSGCKFVLLITDDSITSLHQKYKLIEKSKGMIIQDMKVSRAQSVIVQQKRITLENIVNKSNVKLGGNNYVYNDVKNQLSDMLIIGIGVSNPPAGTKFLLENKGVLNPSIIGFTCNGKNSQEFSGDFILSPSAQETLAPVEDIISESINEYKKWHNGQHPKRVVVYRSGASDGNHGNIMAYEVPLALSAAHKVSNDIKLVYIAVSKDHTYRFFRPNLNALAAPASRVGGNQGSRPGTRPSMPTGPKAWDLNVGPGLMIDTGVTNPACKQFFLNSHITLQGSAKTPLYTVLYDDTNAPMTALEELTYNMCHLHQIVGLPTSLPTPLYVANEYAKRGRNLWTEMSQGNPTQRSEEREQSQLQQLTKDLNYKSVNMTDRRVTA